MWSRPRGWRSASACEHMGGCASFWPGPWTMRAGVSSRCCWCGALDRLSREGPLGMLKVVDRFGRIGVRVISHEESWTEVSNEMLDLLLAITGWVARQESRRKSERVKIGMERAEAEGKRLGRPARRPVEQLRRWSEVRDLVLAGTLTRAEGARRLKVRYGDFLDALNAFRNGGGDSEAAAEVC